MKILLALDGSDPSMTAVAAVATLSIPNGSTIVLLHVLPGEDQIYSGAWPTIVLTPPPEETARARDEIRSRIQSVAASLAAEGRTIEVKIVEGRAASGIVQAAESLPADLIVLGARGHGTVEGLVVGSVSGEVVDHAPCPALVVRTPQVRRVLVATDGSEAADRAAAFVADSGLFEAAELRGLSVVDPGLPWWTATSPAEGLVAVEAYEQMLEVARRHADAAARRTAERLGEDVTADAVEVSGDVASTILSEATAWQAEVVVVGTRGLGMVKRTLLGSVSRDVLHHAPMSVLIVH